MTTKPMTNAAESDIRQLAEETIRLGEQATPDWSSWIYGDLTVCITAPDAETVIAKFAWEDRQSRKQAERNCVFAAHARTAAPALARAVLAMQWRPIAEAPRDGTVVLVNAPSKHDLPAITCCCAWHEDAGWCVDELREVEWWMPLDALPPPPEVVTRHTPEGGDAG